VPTNIHAIKETVAKDNTVETITIRAMRPVLA
jgi:hypothetical protein